MADKIGADPQSDDGAGSEQEPAGQQSPTSNHASSGKSQ